jgi:hypothetical protein
MQHDSVRRIIGNGTPSVLDPREKPSARTRFISWAVTRADIAAFTAAQVDDDRYVGAAPAISN